MLFDFKNYFINIGERDGYPGHYSSYNDLIGGFKLNFEQVNNWKNKLSDNMNFWLASMLDRDTSYVKNVILSLIDDFLIDRKYEVYKFGKEDAEFIKYNLDYLKNDDYIFKLENGTYLLHFGMND